MKLQKVESSHQRDQAYKMILNEERTPKYQSTSPVTRDSRVAPDINTLIKSKYD